jgi:hypothetical protein
MSHQSTSSPGTQENTPAHRDNVAAAGRRAINEMQAAAAGIGTLIDQQERTNELLSMIIGRLDMLVSSQSEVSANVARQNEILERLASMSFGSMGVSRTTPTSVRRTALTSGPFTGVDDMKTIGNTASRDKVQLATNVINLVITAVRIDIRQQVGVTADSDVPGHSLDTNDMVVRLFANAHILKLPAIEKQPFETAARVMANLLDNFNLIKVSNPSILRNVLNRTDTEPAGRLVWAVINHMRENLDMMSVSVRYALNNMACTNSESFFSGKCVIDNPVTYTMKEVSDIRQGLTRVTRQYVMQFLNDDRLTSGAFATQLRKPQTRQSLPALPTLEDLE